MESASPPAAAPAFSAASYMPPSSDDYENGDWKKDSPDDSLDSPVPLKYQRTDEESLKSADSGRPPSKGEDRPHSSNSFKIKEAFNSLLGKKSAEVDSSEMKAVGEDLKDLLPNGSSSRPGSSVSNKSLSGSVINNNERPESSLKGSLAEEPTEVPALDASDSPRSPEVLKADDARSIASLHAIPSPSPSQGSSQKETKEEGMDSASLKSSTGEINSEGKRPQSSSSSQAEYKEPDSKSVDSFHKAPPSPTGSIASVKEAAKESDSESLKSQTVHEVIQSNSSRKSSANGSEETDSHSASREQSASQVRPGSQVSQPLQNSRGSSALSLGSNGGSNLGDANDGAMDSSAEPDEVLGSLQEGSQEGDGKDAEEEKDGEIEEPEIKESTAYRLGSGRVDKEDEASLEYSDHQSEPSIKERSPTPFANESGEAHEEEETQSDEALKESKDPSEPEEDNLTLISDEPKDDDDGDNLEDEGKDDRPDSMEAEVLSAHDNQDELKDVQEDNTATASPAQSLSVVGDDEKLEFTVSAPESRRNSLTETKESGDFKPHLSLVGKAIPSKSLVYKKVHRGRTPYYLKNVRSTIHQTFTSNLNYDKLHLPRLRNDSKGDNDSGVDESTQNTGIPSAIKKSISGRSSFSPSGSPLKNRTGRNTLKPLSNAPRVARSKSVPKPLNSYGLSQHTPEPIKKVPMNKIKVGMTSSPNLKQIQSKIGSLEKAHHRPGGGNFRVESRKLEWNNSSKTNAYNKGYMPSGGDKKIEVQKLDWKAKSRIGSLENTTHRPGGGSKKIQNHKVEWSAASKVGSTDNVKHKPGGGNVKIINQKVELNVKQGKVGSMDNVKHKPGGGDRKVFNDVEYLRQMSENSNASSRAHSNTHYAKRRESVSSSRSSEDSGPIRQIMSSSTFALPLKKPAPKPNSYQSQITRKMSPMSSGF